MFDAVIFVCFVDKLFPKISTRTTGNDRAIYIS